MSNVFVQFTHFLNHAICMFKHIHEVCESSSKLLVGPYLRAIHSSFWFCSQVHVALYRIMILIHGIIEAASLPRHFLNNMYVDNTFVFGLVIMCGMYKSFYSIVCQNPMWHSRSKNHHYYSRNNKYNQSS